VEARRKILVADDSPLFRDLESLFLTRSGDVVTAADGPRALEAARRERPDVAVIDLSMPGMDGDDVCRAIKADPDLETVPVILVVGGDLPDDRERAVRAGADDVIAKPINRVTLIRSVNRFLRARPAGLTRVPLETPVRIDDYPNESLGTARNLSRGGMFVQASQPPPPLTELRLRFTLPDGREELTPTAVVIWRRVATAGAAPGMGVRFLRLDRSSAERIDDFVYQHAEIEPAQIDAAQVAS
jgi:uncharacterized protein (TIGR02266 family)